jgi:hypothetical protein
MRYRTPLTPFISLNVAVVVAALTSLKVLSSRTQLRNLLLFGAFTTQESFINAKMQAHTLCRMEPFKLSNMLMFIIARHRAVPKGTAAGFTCYLWRKEQENMSSSDD